MWSFQSYSSGRLTIRYFVMHSVSFIFFPTGTLRRIDIDLTWILHRYVEDQISMNFHVISTYLFDLISLIEKSASFPRTFFDVISMVENSTLFPRTFFDVTSIVEKSALFLRTFFNVISMVENSTLFPRTFFDVILMVEKSTLLPRTFFSVTSFVEISSVSIYFFDYFWWSNNPICLHVLFSTKFRSIRRRGW